VVVAEAGFSKGLAMSASPGNGPLASAEPTPPKEPGEWRKAKSPARGRSGKYQQQITGQPPDRAYMVGNVEFDGYQANEGVLLHTEDLGGVLLEAKGKGYAKFFDDDLTPKTWFEYTGAKKLVEQAERQVRAAQGTRIRWHVAEEKAANAIRELFKNAPEAKKIEIVHTPVQP
jgi:hypothetical protein